MDFLRGNELFPNVFQLRKILSFFKNANWSLIMPYIAWICMHLKWLVVVFHWLLAWLRLKSELLILSLVWLWITCNFSVLVISVSEGRRQIMMPRSICMILVCLNFFWQWLCIQLLSRGVINQTLLKLVFSLVFFMTGLFFFRFCGHLVSSC